MRYYKVTWRMRGAGQYIEVDPINGCGGGCADLVGMDIIIAATGKIAVAVVQAARPGATAVLAQRLNVEGP